MTHSKKYQYKPDEIFDIEKEIKAQAYEMRETLTQYNARMQAQRRAGIHKNRINEYTKIPRLEMRFNILRSVFNDFSGKNSL